MITDLRFQTLQMIGEFLINLITHKINTNALIIPKTLLSANNHFINRKFDASNNSLFRLIKTFYHSRIRINSLNLNVSFSANMFCKNGIHF